MSFEVSLGDDVPLPAATRLIENIAGVNRMLAGSFSLPSTLGLILCGDLEESTANLYGPPPTLRLSMHLPHAIPGESGQAARVFSIHEYGHIVAHQRAMERKGYREYATVERGWYRELRAASTIISGGTIRPLVPQNIKGSPFSTHGRVAQELFADAVSVLYAKDGRALSRHLDPSMFGGRAERFITPRDFSKPHKEGALARHDYYTVSQVARNEVWKAYEIHGDAARARILADLHDALYDAIDEISALNPAPSWRDERDFLRRLRRHLGKRLTFAHVHAPPHS